MFDNLQQKNYGEIFHCLNIGPDIRKCNDMKIYLIFKCSKFFPNERIMHNYSYNINMNCLYYIQNTVVKRELIHIVQFFQIAIE